MSSILTLSLIGTVICLVNGKTESPHVSMAEAQADFAMKIFQADPSLSGKSSIISPISVAIALAMTYAGAEGNTKTQMEDVLAHDNNRDEILKFFAATMNDLAQPSRGYKLDAANKVYVKEGFELLSDYLNTIKNNFMGQLQEINFGDADAAAKLINEWVGEKTSGKIRDLLSPGSVNNATQMILVNAIYFKGQWSRMFEERQTKSEAFHAKQNEERKIDMMMLNDSFSYLSTDEVAVLGIPYKGREAYMYVFLPREMYGLQDFLKKTTGKKLLQLIRNTEKNDVEVGLPRFKMNTKLGLVPVLKSMGLTSPFDKTANFSGMSNEKLFISDVIHQAFVESEEDTSAASSVSEADVFRRRSEGTEAAAATEVEIEEDSDIINPPEPIKFTADHPFLFVIVDGDIILFMGAYY